MFSFILNNESITAEHAPGITVLDFIRYHKHLSGTKIGCREGDCGACTVLVGILQGQEVCYHSATSCLMPLANAAGKHLVTVEGINPANGLTAVQEALTTENGTQCGFCTVGFVMSLTGFCLGKKVPEPGQAISAIDGNICRCTGYKSIERAADRLTTLMATRQESSPPMNFAVENGVVPAYFLSIPSRLSAIRKTDRSDGHPEHSDGQIIFLGGGTDLYVQRPETMAHLSARNLFDNPALKTIRETPGQIEIGASVTVSELMASDLLQQLFPNLYKHLKLVSSTPIRNMATVAGNLVNASPIGDLTIWLLALDATVVLRNGTTRELPLRDFYLGYKSLAKTADEMLERVRFKIPGPGFHFNFEKVSKRTCLDIASVNSAVSFRLENNRLLNVHLAAGGVAPIPIYLKNTAAFLTGKTLPATESATIEFLSEANHVLQSEISPISDVRGTEAYKRLLIRQLLFAHFSALFSTV